MAHEKPTGKEAAIYMADFVNHMGEEELEPFAQFMANNTHKTLQQSFMRLMWKTMRAFAKSEYYDGRNEATRTLCKEITAKHEDYPPLPFI